MLSEGQLNVNSTERQLLFDIRAELGKSNELLQAILENTKPVDKKTRKGVK